MSKEQAMQKAKNKKAVIQTLKKLIVFMKPKELKPAPYNPRRWNDEQLKQLTDSVKKFGLVDPIICNSAAERKNIVIGGHMRLKVAKDLKLAQVPVIYVNLPDIKDEQELNLRLNKNTGEFDLDLLAQLDKDVLEMAGFNAGEIENIFAEVNPEIIDGINIAEGDKGYKQMTFILANSQAEIVEAAVEQVKKEVKPEYAENENSNGNAIYFICRKYTDGITMPDKKEK
jgi:ParB-like chromosome segregation protein Spo0J